MKRSKIILTSIIGAVALGAGIMSMTVTAAPPTMVETTYFSDASHNVQVGYRIRLCSGRTITNGQVTTFKEVSTEPCM